MTRVAALTEMLASLFSAEELRVHLKHERDGDALAQGLPGTVVSAAVLFSEAVDALRRFGLVDREFFDGLERARSWRLDDIRKVRAQWLHNANLDRGEKWAEGRYELVAWLGTGGFGIVWKAIDTRTREFVALKILQDKYVDDHRARHRFYRGALVLAELDHPAIVKIRSSVEQEGLRFYYVMEFVEGQSLDQIAEPSLEHVWQVGAALAYVHAKELLHRDIKPSNILVSNGCVKLLDFDTVTGDRFERMTTTVLGTELYAPPEAVDRERKKTPAYDVFGLARSAEFVLRGREPTVAERTAADPVATLTASRAVKAVLRAALCADPDERTPSVEQFCADLKRALAAPAEPVEELPAASVIAENASQPDGQTMQIARDEVWKRRTGSGPAVGIVVALGVLVGSVLGVVAAWRLLEGDEATSATDALHTGEGTTATVHGERSTDLGGSTAAETETGRTETTSPTVVDDPPKRVPIAWEEKLWPVGSTITIGFLDGSPAMRAKVERYAVEWTKYANLKFKFIESADAKIRITLDGDASWSYLGTDCSTAAKGAPTMSLGRWLADDTDARVKAAVLHQFGAALGLLNEHLQPEADIKWDKEAVYRHYSGAPYQFPRDTVDSQFFDTVSVTKGRIYREFDPDSIMMIPIAEGFTLDGFTTKEPTELSESDKKFIARLYPRRAGASK